MSAFVSYWQLSYPIPVPVPMRIQVKLKHIQETACVFLNVFLFWWTFHGLFEHLMSPILCVLYRVWALAAVCLVAGKNLEFFCPGFKVQFYSNHCKKYWIRKYTWKWPIFFYLSSLSVAEVSSPAGLIVFPPTAKFRAVLTRMPMVSFSGFSSSSLATRWKQEQVRNKAPPWEICSVRTWTSFTGSIRCSEDVAAVVEAAAVIGGIKRFRVFLPGFCRSKIWGAEILEM